MPRKARIKSVTGVYHIVLRGVNRQELFYDDEDRNIFLKHLIKNKEKYKYELYAYCLMDNHIHLLINTGGAELETVFRSFGASYVYWYNKKHDRVGYLFQERFRSEAVENETYFVTVLRYILRNPVKAGICSRPDEYIFSSMSEYVSGSRGITDVERIIGMVGKDELLNYINTDNEDHCLEDEKKMVRMSDEEAIRIIKNESVQMKLDGNKKERDVAIIKALEKGINVKQLSRIMGVPRTTISAIKNKSRHQPPSPVTKRAI